MSGSAGTMSFDSRLPAGTAGNRPGLARLIRVELRKMTDTRSGFWLQLSVLGLTALVVVIVALAGDDSDHSFREMLSAAIQPASILLPVAGILLVTQEWSQRTGLITFALVPNRGRVIAAKLGAGVVLALAAAVVAVVFSAIGTAVTSPDIANAWSLPIGLLGQDLVNVITAMVTGVAFGAAILASAPAIVVYFGLPCRLVGARDDLLHARDRQLARLLTDARPADRRSLDRQAMGAGADDPGPLDAGAAGDRPLADRPQRSALRAARIESCILVAGEPKCSSSMKATQWLLCPVCAAPLAARGGSAACRSGHSFDFARSGYLNLTRAEQGDGRGPATRERWSRRAIEFLTAGHYAPIAAAVARARRRGGREPGRPPVPSRTAPRPPIPRLISPFLVEIGSGTAYYLAAAAVRLAEHGCPPAAALGIDLSKEAADLAARRRPDLGFVVADVQDRIPVADGSVDALLSVFAPRPAAELGRVIRPGGTLVVAFAGPRHLADLRARLDLMDVHDGKLETLVERLGDAFEPAGEELVERAIVLDRASAENAVLMGPNARHGVDLAALGGGVEDTVSVRVAAFRRTAVRQP